MQNGSNDNIIMYHCVELVEATNEKDMHIIKEALRKVREKQLEARLEREVILAKGMLERIRNINR